MQNKMKRCPCGRAFKQYNSLQKYCSFQCQTKHKDKKRKKQFVTPTWDKRDLTESIDPIWSKIVKILAGYKCEYCGRSTGLQSHHFVTRGNKALRHEVENGICLCQYHHNGSSEFSAHLTPEEFKNWIVSQRGEVWYTTILSIKNSHVEVDQLKLLRKLKFKLKELQRTYKMGSQY